jgi:hypothetical protein
MRGVLKEKDACGIGFVADVRGRASPDIVETAIRSLCRVHHRGAVAADHKSGDGAGLLFPLPRRFLGREAHAIGIDSFDPERWASPWSSISTTRLPPRSGGSSGQRAGWRGSTSSGGATSPSILRHSVHELGG